MGLAHKNQDLPRRLLPLKSGAYSLGTVLEGLVILGYLVCLWQLLTSLCSWLNVVSHVLGAFRGQDSPGPLI